jgi:hypothetical protein
MTHHVRSEHGFTLPLPAEQALALFTPIGETWWVDGWAPRFHHPVDGHTCEGMVFSTGENAEQTVWVMTRYAPAEGHCRYARTTPASRAGSVDVRVRPGAQAGSCEVRVGYDMTALSDAAAETLQPYSGEAFVEMIEGWREAILRALPQLHPRLQASRIPG